MEEREKEIDFRDMIIKIFMKWRWMIVWAVIMAAGLTGLKYLKDKSKSHAGKDKQIVLEEMSKNMTPIEISNVTTYVSLFENLEELRNDKENRVFYQMDPYHEKALFLTYAISLPEIEKLGVSGDLIIAQHLGDEVRLNQIVTLYSNRLSSDELIAKVLSKAKDISESDLRALVSSWTSNGVLYIKVAYTDDMDIEGISEIIKEDIEQYSEMLMIAEKHMCVLTDESYREIVDDVLINTQNNLISREYVLQNQINTFYLSLGATEKEYIDVYFEGQEEDKIEEKESISKDVNINKITVIIGAILGAFLVCMWEMIKYTTSGKVHTPECYSNYFELQFFGIQSYQKNISKRKGIDKLLYKLKIDKRKALSYDEQREIIFSGIKLFCEQKSINDVVFTGSDIEKIEEKYLNELKDDLNKAGIKTTIENNIFYYPMALKKAAEIGNVILFETIDVSTECEIENILQKAVEYGINVLGAVAFENN